MVPLSLITSLQETNKKELLIQQLESLAEDAQEFDALSFALKGTKKYLRGVEEELFSTAV